jgi:REP element-mobilizing transposase RayT
MKAHEETVTKVVERDGSGRFPVRRRIRLPRDVYRDGNVFLVTIGTSERHRWFCAHPTLSQAAVEALQRLATQRDARLYAWCVMPDHVHLLVQDEDVVEFVRLFKGRLTPVARALEPGRRLWQRSFHDHGLRREESVAQVAAYIWENPVRSGLVQSPPEYPWSGSSQWPQWHREYDSGPGDGRR